MIEDSIKKQYTTDDYSFINDTTHMTIPYALIAYSSQVLYNTYLILENQLSQISPTDEIYSDVDTLAQRVYDSWLTLGYRGGIGNGTNIQ